MKPRTEQQIRANLKVGRWMIGTLPLWVVRLLQRVALYRGELPAGVQTHQVTLRGVPCEWIDSSAPTGTVILYLHGGGFVLGNTQLHRRMAAQLAQLTGARILMVDYRLAPKHPFPAALDDCFTVYSALLENGIAPERLVVAGDSAGANLTIGTLLMARDRGLPLAACGICLSPPTDMTEHDVDKWETHPDALLHPRAVRFFLDSYVAHNDATNPLISPVYADLRGLPPLLVYTGEEEGLRDDIVRLADVAAAQGAPLTLRRVDRMWHVWQLFAPDLPEAVESLDEMAAFIAEHTKDPASVHAEET